MIVHPACGATVRPRGPNTASMCFCACSFNLLYRYTIQGRVEGDRPPISPHRLAPNQATLTLRGMRVHPLAVAEIRV
jgi:hypothetical protein